MVVIVSCFLNYISNSKDKMCILDIFIYIHMCISVTFTYFKNSNYKLYIYKLQYLSNKYFIQCKTENKEKKKPQPTLSQKYCSQRP